MNGILERQNYQFTVPNVTLLIGIKRDINIVRNEDIVPNSKMESTCPICGKVRFVQKGKNRLNKPCPGCSRRRLEYWIPKEHYEPNDKVMGSLIGKPNFIYILCKCVDCKEEHWIRIRKLPRKYRCRHCGIKYMWQTTRKHYSPTTKAELGEIRCGEDTDKTYKKCRYIWAKCPNCNYTRWVIYQRSKKQTGLIVCQPCSIKCRIGDKSSLWKGGRFKHSENYINIRVREDDFYYPMATKDGYVMEHRLVMARYLNRCLLSWEIVHHINGIRYDNRLENLQLLPNRQYHITDTLNKSLWKRVNTRFTYLEQLLTNNEITFKPNNIIVTKILIKDKNIRDTPSLL